VSLDSEDRLKAPVALVQWEPDNRWIPGFAIQAQLLRSLLNQNLIQPAPWLTVVLILVGSCFWFDFRLRDKAALFILFSAVVGIVSLIALGEAMLVQIGGAMAVALVSLSSSAAAAGLRQWRERQYLTQTFSGYVSPQVLKGILSGALSAGKEGQRVQACVLFSDIRGFTTLSENLPAERIVELLNSYFERMTNIVHQHGGLVDKFLGDGMMALFGTPVTLETPEKNALDAARAMLLAVDELNIELREKGLSDIRIGIGLHTGELLIGHIGSKDRHEYTAIGDVVNVAARVCDLPKLLGYPIVCTDSVASAVGYPPYLEAAGMQALKGRSDMPVYGWHP
jgi:class 3 adenylate cyclase